MKIDLYASSHARLRRLMHEADVAESASDRARLVGELLETMKQRSQAESRILHPLIGKSLPEVSDALERQHALIEPLIERVASVVDEFLDEPSTENADMLSRSFRRFVEAVLPHMEEEEALVPLLTSIVPPSELERAARALGD